MTNAYLLILALGIGANLADPLAQSDIEQAKEWVAAMKSNPRGPYKGVAWFCNDGVVLPPKAYACQDHGGGIQHGVPSNEALKLADMGIYVGTVLSSIAAEDLLSNQAYRARAFVVEAYLERALDGWVLKSAKDYRGFRQREDEERIAPQLLLELAKNPDLVEKRRALFVRLMRAMPYGIGGKLADEVRTLAGQLGDEDVKGFGELRYKIHAMPEPSDIPKVLEYAEQKKEGPLAEKAMLLAEKMRATYDPTARVQRLKQVRAWMFDKDVRKNIDAFVDIPLQNTIELISAGTALIEAASSAIQTDGSHSKQPDRNLLLLNVMTLVDQLWVGVTADLSLRSLTRGETLDLIGQLLRAARSLGFISPREHASSVATLENLRKVETVTYAHHLAGLRRVLEWARNRAIGDLGIALERYAAIEPRAQAVVDDQLRSGVMLPLATLMDRLSKDADRVAGKKHRFLGTDTLPLGSLRGENSGIALGTLQVILPGDDLGQLTTSDIAFLQTLPPELPPVAGIVTLGAAGSLSHVAMLARNLGIPHASVGEDLSSVVSACKNKPFVLGVTATARVIMGLQSDLLDADKALLQSQKEEKPQTFRIDEASLDLGNHRVRMLSEISELHSGVIVGPKAAELGRLKRLFPNRVSDGAVIPFGAFVRHVNRPGNDGALSPLENLKSAYHLSDQKAPVPKPQQEPMQEQTSAEDALAKALSDFRHAIQTLPFPDGFEADVKAALLRLGPVDSFGVFVRSDTNVEDLKNFTGAGLNLTVPNVVKQKDIFAAIRKVWASPFQERSLKWRQRLLENPEHVYPSVILHQTVPCDISGVMVTADLETGASDAITISATEGVAGVVDGGMPETLVLEQGRHIRLLSSCHTPTRKVVPAPPAGGIVRMLSEGHDPLLSDQAVDDLLLFTKEIQEKMPSSENIPWDIEFGFSKGKAYLMQIRPLRTSNVAAMHPWLSAWDSQQVPIESGLLNLEEVIP